MTPASCSQLYLGIRLCLNLQFSFMYVPVMSHPWREFGREGISRLYVALATRLLPFSWLAEEIILPLSTDQEPCSMHVNEEEELLTSHR